MATPQYKIKPLPRPLYPTTISYTSQDFQRRDESSDAEWYAQPRFVQHIDDGAITTLKSYYETIITRSHNVLDLCSSWVSHLPSSLTPESMIGIGLNAQELARNAHLTQYYVQDLNTSPSMEQIQTESIDVVICNVSVDYLVRPIEVFSELRRVLRGKGTAHMVFSNRCFATKVIGRWIGMSDEERRWWVGGYFWKCGGWEEVEEVVLKDGKEGFWGGEDPLFVVRARKAVD